MHVTGDSTMSSNTHPSVAQVGLISLFITALVSAQVTASKVLAFGLPFGLPLAGEALVLPGAAVAYALTFFASDCYTELYGKRAAQVVVNVGFVMNFVLLLLVWSTISAPVAPNSPVAAGTFQQVLGASTGVVVASLVAYLVSQNWDVLVFHRIREITDGDALWLRNIGSTATSQLLDTVIFVTIAFVVFQGVPLELALSLMVGQYVFKLLVAIVDTPFVYLVVGAVRSRESGAAEPTVAD